MRKLHKKLIIFSFIAIIVIAGVMIGSFTRKECEVTFYSDDNEILLIDNINCFEQATPPQEPQMTYGKIFKSWDKDFSSVKKDMDIYPVTEDFSGKANVFALPGVYGNVGEYITVPFKLCGEVCLSGFDAAINYDNSILELESIFNEDGAVIYNAEKKGVIRINYVSVGNTIGDVDICTLKFKIKKYAETIDLSIEVNSVCANKNDSELYTPDTNIINSTIFVSEKSGIAND